MDRKVAKELLHVRDWLVRAQDVVARGHEAYTTDELLQEAGDSLMMKLGDAAGRLARAGVEPPPVWHGLTQLRIATGSSISTTRSTAPSRGSPVSRPDLLASRPNGDVR